MSNAEAQDITEKAGFEWESLGFRDRMCFSKLVELAEAKEREAFTRICLEIAAEQEEIMRAHSGKEGQDDDARFDNAYEMAHAARLLAQLVPGRRASEKEAAQ